MYLAASFDSFNLNAHTVLYKQSVSFDSFNLINNIAEKTARNELRRLRQFPQFKAIENQIIIKEVIAIFLVKRSSI